MGVFQETGKRLDARALAQSISTHVEIIKVIERDVALKRTGKNFRGLCPFHQEKSPSFFVHPSRHRFFCYGCHEGGDVVYFVQKIRGVSFREACEIIITDFNLPIQLGQLGTSAVHQRKEIEKMYRLQDFAARFYHSRLGKVPEVTRYLTDRAISKPAQTHFQLGVSAWETRDALYSTLKKQVERKSEGEEYVALAQRLGLWYKNSGNVEDRFFQRLMFPIRNIRGKVVGFGSRIVSDAKDVPKYINSAESAVFAKRDILYGFFENFDDIRKTKEMFLVEGYFDVIKLWQHGIRNVCATMGTALSEEWVKRLKKSLKKLVILFDGDSAGIRSMVQVAELFFKHQWEPDVLVLPGGLDPDEFLDQHGKAAFDEHVRRAQRYFDFYFMQRFQEVKHSAFDLIALYEHLADILAASSPYSVALSRLEGYLGVAGLGTQTESEILSRLKKKSGKEKAQKGASSRFSPNFSPHSSFSPQVEGALDRLRLIQIALYDPAFIEDIQQRLHNVLKEKEFCALLSLLNESLSVLETLTSFEDRVQFVQYSQPPSETANGFFAALLKMDKTGLDTEALRRDIFEQIVQRVVKREEARARKMQLLEFKQRYGSGQMTWDEVISSLENMQHAEAKDTDVSES